MIVRACPVGRPTNPVEITIRLAGPWDAEAIADLHHRSSLWAYQGVAPSGYLEDIQRRVPEAVERNRARLADPGEERWWVAERERQVLGFVLTSPRAGEDPEPGTGEVLALYVDPEAVGQGVGRALLQRAVEELKWQGCREAVLWVLDGNHRARRLYESAG